MGGRDMSLGTFVFLLWMIVTVLRKVFGDE